MNSVIIVAGGKGLRMGKEIPKQFLLLKNKPILMHTIERFVSWDKNCEVVLVLPQSQHDYWSSLCDTHNFNHNIKLTTGGETRFHSVKNGLAIATGDLIGIHDGVRPLVSHNTITACYQMAQEKGNAIPCIPVNDSLRKIEGEENRMVDRSQYQRIQTPQVFQSSIIKGAFKQDFSNAFTDDSSVIEKNGETVCLVEGNEENIKITRPVDLAIAEVLL